MSLINNNTMMMTAATAVAHCPPQRKYNMGPQEEEGEPDPSVLMMYPPPPNKKAKFHHHHQHHDDVANNATSSSDENTDNDYRQIISSSPTDVLAHPVATTTDGIFPATTTPTAAATAVVKTVPPSLKGINEAVKGLHSSLRSRLAGHSQQQQSTRRPQLMAFPTEALYVLTCCVKTTSKKKILLANAAATTAGTNSSCAVADNNGTNSCVKNRQDDYFDGKSSSSSSSGDNYMIHPSNPSLDHLLSRQTPIHHHQQQQQQQGEEEKVQLSSRLSVFVIDSRHAQHYCQFSRPKIFAIRPKAKEETSSGDVAVPSLSSSSSLLAPVAAAPAPAAEGSRDEHHGTDSSSGQDEQQEVRPECTTNTTYSCAPSSPIKLSSSPPISSSSSTRKSTPKRDMMESTLSLSSSSSLCRLSMTPKEVVTENTIPSSSSSSSSSSVATVSPIIANNKDAIIAHNMDDDDDVKMPTSLPPLSITHQNNPSNNSNMNHCRISKLDNNKNKLLAVNFSESYEAFSRLANKFWPGPMIIYAPARMIGGKEVECDTNTACCLPKSHTLSSRSSSNASSSSSSSLSCPSLPSCTNLYSLEKGEAPAATAGNTNVQVSVLPPSVLIPSTDLLLDRRDGDTTTTNNNNTKEDQFFIGMQCPSHPLARRILTEIHRPLRRGVGGSTTSTSASSSSTLSMKHSISTESFASFSSLDTSNNTLTHRGPGKQLPIRCGIAVVGSYIAPFARTGGYSIDDENDVGREEDGESEVDTTTTTTTTTTVIANSAANVTRILSSAPPPPPSRWNNNNLQKQGGTTSEQIYVVNGEDTTHENFSVPTCNYGGVSPISLVVDGDNRTIYLLRHQNNIGEEGCCGTTTNFNKEMIYRALLQPPSSSFKSTLAVQNVDNNGSNCNSKASSSTKDIDRVITAVLSRWKIVERHAS